MNTTHIDGNSSSPYKRKVGNYRWTICALLFVATTINYIDRQVLAILKPMLEEEFNWSESDYAYIIMFFQFAYAAGYMGVGRLMDKIGVKVGLPLAVGLWSVAAIAHGLVSSVGGFCFARFSLGLAEGGNFPASIKAVGEWFPAKERAFATGLFNSGSNIGALVGPILVGWCATHYGWRWAFYITGSLGLFWLIGWILLYDKPKNSKYLSKTELEYIQSDKSAKIEVNENTKISWIKLFNYPTTWAFSLSMFLIAPVWWFYLFWVPDFLHKSYGLDLMSLGVPLVIIYLITDFGSIGGGWLSSYLIKKGWGHLNARRFTFFCCSLFVLPVCIAPTIGSLWISVTVIGLAAAAHQGFAANLYTIVSDTMPNHTVSSIVGIGGLVGAISGMFVAKFVGYILDTTHSYVLLFTLASGAYFCAFLLMHFILPKGRGI